MERADLIVILEFIRQFRVFWGKSAVNAILEVMDVSDEEWKRVIQALEKATD